MAPKETSVEDNALAKLLQIASLLFVAILMQSQALAAGAFFYNTKTGDIYFYSSARTVAQAESKAKSICLKDAKKAKYCKLKRSFVGYGTFVLSRGEGGFGVAMNSDTGIAANDAFDECNRIATRCESSGMPIIYNDNPIELSSTGDCRPFERQPQCKKECNDGDCILTYSNGCQMRTRFSPSYNRQTGLMELAAPEC